MAATAKLLVLNTLQRKTESQQLDVNPDGQEATELIHSKKIALGLDSLPACSKTAVRLVRRRLLFGVESVEVSNYHIMIVTGLYFSKLFAKSPPPPPYDRLRASCDVAR